MCTFCLILVCLENAGKKLLTYTVEYEVELDIKVQTGYLISSKLYHNLFCIDFSALTHFVNSLTCALLVIIYHYFEEFHLLGCGAV
jgi:hypothetical protein